MPLSLYKSSVPSFERCLTAFLAILDKAEAHAKARKFDPTNYLGMRVAPDMFPFVRQVQTFCDNAKNAPSRLAGVAAPVFEDKEATFAELRDRVARTSRFSRRSMRRPSTRPWTARSCSRPVPPSSRCGAETISSTMSCRTSISIWRRPTTSCAPPGSRSASAISSAPFRVSSPRRTRAQRDCRAMTITRLHAGPRMAQAVIHGGAVYLAGQVADKAKGGSVAEQTKEILATVDAPARGSRLRQDEILSATIYLADIATFAEMNAVWDAWVPAGHAPARATVEATLAAPSLRRRVVCIAA